MCVCLCVSTQLSDRVYVFVYSVNIRQGDDIESHLRLRWSLRARLCILDQSIRPNEKAPHTHTNTPNPPDSSVSLGGGLCSHGGALLLPGGGQVEPSQGVML